MTSWLVNWRQVRDPHAIRSLLRDAPMTGTSRKQIGQALKLVEGYWTAAKRNAYRERVAERDAQQREFVAMSRQLRDAIAQVDRDLGDGLISAGAARRRLQELAERRRQLLYKDAAIKGEDTSLERIEAQTLDDYARSDDLSKYTSLSTAGGLTLGRVVDMLNEDPDLAVSDLQERFPRIRPHRAQAPSVDDVPSIEDLVL